MNEATTNELALREFESEWAMEEERLKLIPGKDAFSYINHKIHDQCGINVTPTAVIDKMNREEIPQRMKDLINALAQFSSS